METLKIDKLLSFTKREFDKILDKRGDNKSISLGDMLQGGLAMFHLKDASLLKFLERFEKSSGNLLRIYKIGNQFSDTQMRAVLDGVFPFLIQGIKSKLIRKVETAGYLKDYDYIGGRKLLLIDGVHHHSSATVNCNYCKVCNHKDGSKTYSHSMLAGVLAYPGKKVVLPLREEAIVAQDGVSKNDSELRAVSRLLKGIEQAYPEMRFIVVEDALYSNGPHIRELLGKGHTYILRVKKGSGAGYVFEQYKNLLKQGKVTIKESYEEGVWKVWHYVNDLILNGTHKDIKVNFLHYEERDPLTGRCLKTFDWITCIKLTEWTYVKVAKGGRCRWMIENETFNTLKNQGYNFGHNYGHGFKYLCTNFAFLMMMAFLLDQIQQLCNGTFIKAWTQQNSKSSLWQDIRSFFRILPFNSMDMIYKAIIYGINIKYLVIQEDSG